MHDIVMMHVEKVKDNLTEKNPTKIIWALNN